VLVALALAIFVLTACLLAPTASAAEASGFASLCLDPPTLTSVVPGDTAINDQPSINCFAWQEFISLNWLASGGDASTFGVPGDRSPVAWEEFVDVSNLRIHLRSARPAEPPPADFEVPAPESCPADGSVTMTLRQSSKFSIEFDGDDSTGQAFPEGKPAWLADRDGNPVLYQILVSPQEYRFIVSHGFADLANQYPRVALGTHVDMPRGVLGGDVGSIEIKAAWLTLPPGSVDDPRWRRYKLSRAHVYDEGDGDCEVRTVALVGLHVIHKTTSNPQWIWSTFEHVDNAPDAAAVEAAGFAPGDRYLFWSGDCVERPVSAECAALTVGDCKPVTPPPTHTSCTPNTTPAYCLDLFDADCPAYPIQVTREVPIADTGDNLVRQISAASQQLIRQGARRDSVWQHYQLVGTVWSGSPEEQNATGSQPPLEPLTVAGMRPNVNALPVANTTLETYVQSATCLNCHQGAEIAVTDDSGSEPYAADYSFVLQSLKEGGTTDEERAAKKAAMEKAAMEKQEMEEEEQR